MASTGISRLSVTKKKIHTAKHSNRRGTLWQKEAKYDRFFSPFLKEMKSLKKNGGISVKHNREHHLFMPIIISASCDLPAKADVQGLIGHSGRFACGYCLNPGVAIKASTD